MRPSKYSEDIPDKVVSFMKQGYSIEEICLELNVAKKTFYNWCKKHDELLHAKKRGTDFSLGWWMKNARENLENPKFNATLFYMNMRNRFGWADKKEIDHTTGGKPITIHVIPDEE
ncbi:hypothetical protein LCGC14_0370910 [marine sediment metagenome]|uniref:Uncharacterized protein n=1 Tax=marine sediment metagenome TaxID=412755 RepID=A0A0F9T5C3_9ZZZZ|nr:helix-turn-helix domain-containing protein [Maribacter sp.]HDZ04852.1 hypothetical protein [Maribacter sp.]